MIASWHVPLPSGKTGEELLVAFDRQREKRVLILPAWFDEANKMRRFTVELMRALDTKGIDSFLPDLPGCNESLEPLEEQTVASWRAAALKASEQVKANSVLAIRAGANLAPPSLPGWLYAPQTGEKALRAMIRARIISAREEGREEDSLGLLDQGKVDGLMLVGWTLGATMLRELETTEPLKGDSHLVVEQSQLGGAGLWLRAEPDEDYSQVETLVDLVRSEAPDQQ